MGDVILTSSVVRCLKEQLDCEIDFLVKEIFSPMVSENPHISEVLYFKKPVESAIATLKEKNYDIIIDLQKNSKSKTISKALNVKTFTFNKLNVKKWILVQSGINLLPQKHIVDRYFESLAGLNIQNDQKGNELFISAEAKSSVAMLKLPENYIALAVGAQHKGKTMNEDQLVHIVNEAPLPVILIGGAGERELADAVKSLSDKKTTINLVGKTSMLESAEIIKNALLVISGDTGAMHIASAFSVPQLSVWGCTTPDLGMWPYLAHKDSMLLQPEDHSHRPCSKLGNRCKYAPNWCMHSIALESISGAVTRILSKQGL